MELFLNIYKRQILTVLALLIIITIINVFSVAEASMFILITLGVVFTGYGIFTITSHLCTPSTFRSCDIKFLKGLLSILLRWHLHL